MKSLTTRIAFLIVSLIFCTAANSQNVKADSELESALSKFVTAFENLDWDTFRLSFADGATVFYPRAFPERAQGRTEYERAFKVVFTQIRGNKVSAPYMEIRPRGLLLQNFGDVAIVSFHLDDRPGFLNRRTMVWHRTAAGWRIVHLHASEVPIPVGTR